MACQDNAIAQVAGLPANEMSALDLEVKPHMVIPVKMNRRAMLQHGNEKSLHLLFVFSGWKPNAANFSKRQANCGQNHSKAMTEK